MQRSVQHHSPLSVGIRGSILCLLLCLFSCEQKPEGLLSKGEMEEVLYDYHIAQFMASSLPFDDRYKSRIYIDAVYDKHGITEAQFDSSLVYYNRHTDDIKDIYDHVKHRLEDYEANLHFESGNDEIRASYTLGGDTADIWSGSRIMMLRDNPYLNRETFTIKADTSFHLNDHFQMRVDFDFIRQDQNNRDEQLTAGLSIHFKNGKIISSVRSSNYPSHYDLNLHTDNREINYISIFFMLQGQNNGMRSLGIVRNIALYRFHTTSQAYSSDSITTDTLDTDTLAKDTLPTITDRKIMPRINPDELRKMTIEEDKQGAEIRTAPAVRTPNSIGPSRRVKKKSNK